MQTLERLMDELETAAGDAQAERQPSVAAAHRRAARKVREAILAEVRRMVAGKAAEPVTVPANAAEYREWRYWLVNQRTGLIEDGSGYPGYWRDGDGYLVMENRR